MFSSVQGHDRVNASRYDNVLSGLSQGAKVGFSGGMAVSGAAIMLLLTHSIDIDIEDDELLVSLLARTFIVSSFLLGGGILGAAVSGVCGAVSGFFKPHAN